LDSLTHIALGACIGEAFFEKGFGKKAMVWGALAQSIPDVDFIAATWLSPAENLLAHRGFTHSVPFALLIIPAFAWVADRVHKPHNIAFKTWIFFFTTEVMVHLFIDGFNNYGVGWFEPFSHHRYSFNTIYVADPFFSILPGVAFLMLLILNRYHPRRKFWWKLGVIAPVIYLCYCTVNKIRITQLVNKSFATQHIPHERYFTTPAPLQNWLWYVVAGNDSGYYVGFRSMFDSKQQISYQFFPKNDSLLKEINDHEDVHLLKRFSQQFYTIEKWKDTLVFNDLRFGQILGWQDPTERFVFHYYLQHPDDNKLVVQRGRFAKWNRKVLVEFCRRIRGN